MSSPRDQIAAAEQVATDAHAGQTDKAGRPYLDHPRRVATQVALNDLARVVKQADLWDNTHPDRVRLLDPADAERLRRKYQHAAGCCPPRRRCRGQFWRGSIRPWLIVDTSSSYRPT